MRKRHKTRYPGLYYRLEDEGKPAGPRRYIVWYSDANGKGHTQTLPLEASLEEARLLQGQLQSRKASGETLVRTRKTVGELLDEWMDSQRGRVKPKTVEDYEGAIRRLKKAFGTRKVTELSPSDVARLIGQMKQQGLKTWTVRKTLTPLRMAYAVAVREGWVSSSPVDKLLPSEKPKGDASEKRCLSKDEITRLLVSTRDRQGGDNHRWKALFALLCFTGLRISEALALTWNDVTEDRVIVREGKTDAAKREVILIPAVRSLLAAWKLKQPPGVEFVFGTAPGRSCGRREALTRLRATCKRAEIPSYTLHELRHTFASILIAQGELPTLVAKQMGHADPGVTMKTYAHLFEAVESTDRARERLQEAMGGMV